MRPVWRWLVYSGLVASLGMAVVGASAGVSAKRTSSSASRSDADGTIKIGVIQMLTGSSGFYGQQLLKGNKLAADEINARGGLFGKKIEIMSADNASDNAQTVNLARKFGQDSSIPALIAPTYDPNFNAACAISNSIGIPQIGGQSSPPPSNVNRKGFCFTNSAAKIDQVDRTIGFTARRYHVKKWALVYDQQNAYQVTYSNATNDYLKTLAGAKVVARSGVNTGATDYGPVITKLLQASPDAVVPHLTIEDAARFLQQARARGLKALWVEPSSDLLSPRLYPLSGGAAEGLIVSTNQSETDPRYGTFVKNFTKRYGKIEDPISGYGYDSMVILSQAIKKAGGFDRGKIKAALASMKTVCASTCYKSDSKGNFQTTQLYFLRLTKNGFVPVR